jgi:hypothetical protein
MMVRAATGTGKAGKSVAFVVKSWITLAPNGNFLGVDRFRKLNEISFEAEEGITE